MGASQQQEDLLLMLAEDDLRWLRYVVGEIDRSRTERRSITLEIASRRGNHGAGITVRHIVRRVGLLP